jgi:hypothetical protein
MNSGISFPCVISVGGGSWNWALAFNNTTLNPRLGMKYDANNLTSSVAIAGFQTWNHVAFSFNRTSAGAGTAYIFVNGQPGGSMAVTGLTYSAAETARIGGYVDSGNYFNGYIRDLRVVQGGVVPVATFTPLASAPFSYASPTYVANMGTTVFTLLGQFVTYVPGKFGSAIKLTNPVNADTEYISYPIPTIRIEEAGFSCACWVNFQALPPSIYQGYFLNFYGSTSTGLALNLPTIYALLDYATSKIVLVYYVANNTFMIPTDYVVSLNTWYHFAFTIYGGYVRMYINGTQTTNPRTYDATTYANLNINTRFNLGNSVLGGYSVSFTIDDLRIYNTALTAAQVRSVYSSQGAPAPSRAMPLPKYAWDFNGTTADYVIGLNGVNNGTSVNKGFAYTSGKYNQSLIIRNDVTGQGAPGVYNANNLSYSLTGTYSTVSGFAITTWFNCTSLSSSYRSLPLFFQGTNWGVFLIFQGGSGINCQYYDGTSYPGSPGGLVPVTGVWYHIAMVMIGNNLGLYINGVYVGAAVSSIANSSTCSLTLSDQYAPTWGQYDDLRIFDRALTSAQVQSIYNQQGVPGRGVTTKVVPTFTVSDQSQNSLTMSTYGTLVTDSSSPIGGTEGCLSNCAIAIPSSVSKTNFNFFASNCFVEWFFYSAGSASGYPRIFSRGLYPNEPFFIEHIAPGDRLLLSGFSTYSGYSPSFPLNQWNHFSYSFNSQNSTLYRSINGSVMSEVQTVLPTHSTLDSVYINCGLPGQTDMKISNFRLVQNATTLPYITNGFTVPTAPLSNYPTGTTALLLRSVSPLTMFSGGAIQSAIGGNTVQDIGGYRIHTFTTVGTSTFTPASAGNVEVLVVGGGGGGGCSSTNFPGGGGGAGEVYYASSLSLSQGAYTINIGSGGAGSSDVTGRSVNGNSSNVFIGSSPIVSTNGGGGGGNGSNSSLSPQNIYQQPQNGGSGGGSGRYANVNVVQAISITTSPGGLGNPGGFTGTNINRGSGGGGATSAGGGGINNGATGLGGSGFSTAVSGSSQTYGTGGNGGNFNGGAGANGAANTGNGGTGADGGAPSAGGNGGSGIVIVRYPLPIRLTGTPLFTQLSPSATSSAVGAFSLRAVNGTSARAVNVAPGGTFPPSAMTQTGTNLSTQTLGTGKLNGSYIASSSTSAFGGGASGAFGLRSDNPYIWQVNSYPVGGGTVSTPTTTTTGATNYNGEWLQFQTPFPINLTGYSAGTDFLTSVVLLASTTGATSSWILVDSKSAITVGSTITNTGLNFAGYSYFRFVVITSTINYPLLRNVRFFGTVPSLAQDFYADRLGNLLTAPVTGQSLANWLGGATGYVTKWYDQSGRGNHMEQATASNQPTMNLSTTPVSITMTGVEYFQNTVPFTFNFGSGAFTLRYVVSNNTGGLVLYKASKSDFVWNSPYEKKFWLGDGTATEGSRGGYPSKVGNSENYVIGAAAIGSSKTSVVHKATSTTAIPIYVNGTLQTLARNDNTMGTDPGNFLYFGRGGNASNYIGNLHEIQIFSTALSDSDRLALENGA